MSDRINRLYELLDEIDALEEGFEAAKVGTVRSWQKGDFKKTNKGWVPVPRKGGGKPAAPAPTGKKPAAAPKPATGAKPAPKPAPQTTTQPPKKPLGKPGAKPKPGAKAPGKPAPKQAPGKTAPKGGKKAPGKTDKPKTPAEISPEDVELPAPSDEVKKQAKQTSERLKKSGTIGKGVTGVWGKMKNAFKSAAGKNRITQNFMEKLSGEAHETGQMLKTIGRAFIPGSKLSKKEIVAAQHQFVDLAKSALMVHLAASPLGVVAVGLTAAGVRMDKVFDAFIDKPLRKATKKAFGKEVGLLPSRFYDAMDEDLPTAKKYQEWKHDEDGDLEDGEEEVSRADMQAASAEEATNTLGTVMQQVLDYMAQMDPHDDDFAQALIDAGVSPDQIEDFIKFADAAQPISMPGGPEEVDESIQRFRRLARLD